MATFFLDQMREAKTGGDAAPNDEGPFWSVSRQRTGIRPKYPKSRKTQRIQAIGARIIDLQSHTSSGLPFLCISQLHRLGKGQSSKALFVLSLVCLCCRLEQRSCLSLRTVELAYLAAMHGSGSKTRAVACFNEFSEMF